MKNLGLLVLRGSVGGLLAGHGAQKLFGSFEGPGLEGTAKYLEGLGLRPGRPWAALAGLSEFAGGVLTLTGFLNPLGPLSIIGSMAVASVTQHRAKPIWATEGGAELPVTNLAAAATLMLAGPGALSLDRAFDVRLPRWVAPAGLIGVGAAVTFAAQRAAEASQSEQAETEEETETEQPQPKSTDQVVEHLPTAQPAADIRDADDTVPADVRAASGSAIVTGPPSSESGLGR